MSELEKMLARLFKKVLDSARHKGEEDSNIKSARDAARFYLQSTIRVGDIDYLNCPDLNLPNTNHSGIKITDLFGAGGQHYVFKGEIEDFDNLYLAPFYVDLRKHQIRAERGGKIDRVRQDYRAEAKDELEYFLKNRDYISLKNKIMPLLKSKFKNGKCVIRIPNYLDFDEDNEPEAVGVMKDNLRRAAALDGLVHDSLLFSAGRYKNQNGRPIQIVEYVPAIINPYSIYRQFNLQEIVKLTKKALQALAVLSDLGVVHRDIKPDNIFVSRGIRENNLKVSDYDMMKITKEGREHGASSTQTFGGMSVKGTPRYHSREQAYALDDLGAQSDICSLGLTVYKWWTGYHAIYIDESWRRGEMPYKLEILVSEEAAKRDHPPVLPTRIESRALYNGKRGFFRNRAEREFEEGFQSILAKMIATDCEERYKTPEDAIADINAILEGLWVNTGINVYSVFSTSRRDISTSKKRDPKTN